MAVTPFKSSDNFNMAGFNEKITEADNTYVAKTGGSMTGALSMGNNKITDVASPVNDGDAVNKGYVEGRTIIGSYIGTGSTSTKTLNFSSTPLYVDIQPLENSSNSEEIRLKLVNGCSKCIGASGYSDYTCLITWGANSVSWKSLSNRSTYNFDAEGKKYIYFAILK